MDNASKNRVRINDRIFLNNELMLRGFERRGIGPRAESITSKPEEVLHRNSKQPPVEAGYALGGNGQFLASARLEFPFPDSSATLRWVQDTSVWQLWQLIANSKMYKSF